MGNSSSKQSNTMPTGSTVSTPQLPSYMQPYVGEVLERGRELYFDTPYTPYTDDRIAGFTPEETSVHEGIKALQPPGQYGAATDFATRAGNIGLGAYQPAPAINVPNFLNWGGGYGVGPEGVPSGYQMTSPGQVTSERTEAPQMTAAQTGFAPNLQTFQMEGPERVAAERASTDSFVQPGVASQYMSPYMQNVVDVQKQEAIRDAQKAQLGQNLGAARQGTYGGARQLLAQTERERALGQQLGQIQATGSQAAYDAAQRQFEAEQGRGLQAQQTNILSQLEAARANQEAELKAGETNLAAKLGVQDLSTKAGLDTALANLTAAQQTNVQNLAAKLQAQGMNQEQALRAALANQQTEFETGRTNLGARMDLNKLYSSLGLDVSKANVDAEMEARRLGLTGATIGLDASKTLGDLGSSELDNLLKMYGAKGAVGEDIRGMEQLGLDMRYQDFLRQQGYDEEQLKKFADLLGGVPSPGSSTVTSTYSQPTSLASQLAGLGMAGYGAYKTFNSAEGGEIKAYNNGGLVALAGGGSADDTPEPYTVPQSPKGLAMAYGDKQKLGAAVQQGIVDPTSGLMAAMYLDRMQTPAPQAPQGTVKDQIFGQGLASAPLPDNVFTAAEGGIVGYGAGDSVKYDYLAPYIPEGVEYTPPKPAGYSIYDVLKKPFASAEEKINEREKLIDFLTATSSEKDKLNERRKLFNKSLPELRAEAEAKGLPILPGVEEINTKQIPQRRQVSANVRDEELNMGLPAITPTSAPAPQVQPAQLAKEEPPVDFMAKAKELFAGVPSTSMSPEELAAMKKQQGYEALMQFGANLASSKSPTFFGGLGEAAGATAPAIMEISKAQRAEQAAKKKEDREMAITQIQTALGLERDAAEKMYKQQELKLAEKELSAREQEIKANKEAKLAAIVQRAMDAAEARQDKQAANRVRVLSTMLSNTSLEDPNYPIIMNELMALGGSGGEAAGAGGSKVQDALAIVRGGN